MSHAVAIVVNRDFGPTLLQLADRLPVWVCGTPANRELVARHRALHPTYSPSSGCSLFTVEEGQSTEDMLLQVLGEVELHHGLHSQPPGWDSLEVYGTTGSDSVREALAELGVTAFAMLPGGFRCTRRAGGAA